MSARRGLAMFALVVAAAAVFVPGVAFAHDPIIITDDQTTPRAGPLLPDGTISFALYGVIDAPGATRGLRVRFAAGDAVNVTLLVPALDPEQNMADADLPTLTMVRADGSTETFTPTERVRFDESFSGTSYVRLVEVAEPALAGEYQLTVTAATPARFTVSVGTNERFGTPVENVVDRANASRGIAAWYATSPPAAPVSTTAGPTSTPVPTSTTSTSTTSTSSTATSSTSATPTTDPVTTPVPQTGEVDGAAGSAVFIGVIAVLLGGGLLLARRQRGTKL